MEKVYVVMEDLQGEDYMVGTSGTATELREIFINSRDWQPNEPALDILNMLEGQELVDYIASFWSLKIE